MNVFTQYAINVAPSCSPVIGNVNGKYLQAFVSLTGNWQATIGQDVVSENTKVSVHYDFKKLSGEGIAKTLKTIENAPVHEVNSSEGSVSRIECPKPIVDIIKHLPVLKIITQTPTPLAQMHLVPTFVTDRRLTTPNRTFATYCQTTLKSHSRLT